MEQVFPVPSPHKDADEVYTDMKFWTEVRRYVLTQGHSKRSACRHFSIHWKTLKKILDHPEPPGYRRDQQMGEKKIDKFLPILHQILEDDRKAPRKQRHTIRRVFEVLRDQHGFDGKITIVSDAVRAWKRVNAQTYVPLSHPPGEAQVDFGEATIFLYGQAVKAALFVMSLPYSDAVFIRAYPRECTESFQDGHVRAFEFFGGVPTRISYDNSRIAVKKFVGPRKRELTDGFLRLQSHYLFDEHFCLVRKANEKGHVENLVGYTRRNFLVPIPRVRSFAELNDHLNRCCLAEWGRSLRGKGTTKGQRLDEERSAMSALPDEAFEARRVVLCRANSLSLVRFDRNDYSVPVAWAHHALTVIGDIETVRVMCGDQVIAEHPRDWCREQVHFDPVHYLALLERRPGAFDVAQPLEQWDLPPCFGVLRRKLEADWGSKGTRQFIQVLRLLERVTQGQLKQAVHKALELGTVTPDAVRVILDGLNEQPVALFSLDGRPHLSGVHVAKPDLSAYGCLLQGLTRGDICGGAA
jgi:transposase